MRYACVNINNRYANGLSQFGSKEYGLYGLFDYRVKEIFYAFTGCDAWSPELLRTHLPYSRKLTRWKYSILPITRTSKGPMKMVRVNECSSYVCREDLMFVDRVVCQSLVLALDLRLCTGMTSLTVVQKVSWINTVKLRL